MKPEATTRRQIAATKEQLMDAIEDVAHCRANASFLSGYRAAGKDTDDVQKREMDTWVHYSQHVRPRLDRALRAYTTAVRRGAISSSPRKRAVGKTKPGKSA